MITQGRKSRGNLIWLKKRIARNPSGSIHYRTRRGPILKTTTAMRLIDVPISTPFYDSCILHRKNAVCCKKNSELKYVIYSLKKNYDMYTTYL